MCKSAGGEKAPGGLGEQDDGKVDCFVASLLAMTRRGIAFMATDHRLRHRAQKWVPVLRTSIRPSANRAGGTIGGEKAMRHKEIERRGDSA
jgi:hypothetical protein